MTLAATIAHKIWAFIVTLLGLFRRLICRSGRGRKNSGTILPMTQEHIAVDLQQSVPSNDYELQAWDSWGAEEPGGAYGMTPSQHGNPSMSHPHQRNNLHPQDLDEEEPNFFQDMTPKIKKTAKVLVKKREDNYAMNGGISSRLAFTADEPIQVGNELGRWEETENAWGDEAMEDLSWEADAAIREKRRLEREKKIAEHQRKKMEKETMRNSKREAAPFSAVKLS